MLVSFDAPQNLWGEALLIANYILNRVPHKKLDLILFELWHGRTPSYNYIKIWECLAKVLAPLPSWTKTMDSVFIGYALNNSAYRFLVHKSEIPDIHVNMIIESRADVFFEDIFSYKLETDKTSEKRTHEMTFRNESPEEPIVNAEIEPRRSQRSRISKSFCNAPIPAGTETLLRRIYAGQKYPHVYTLSISTGKNQSA